MADTAQEMEGQCEDMQEDIPDIFSDNCIGRYTRQATYPLLTRILNRYQGLIWDLIEHPESSTAANIVSYIAMSFVLISTVVMSLNTMQVISSVSSIQSYKNSHHFKGLKVLDKKGNLQPHPFLEIIEAICIAWFTLEFIIR